jgi:phosphoribosylformimino-5-aminoimidazole carboxamide ribotide isomerase
VKSGKGMGGLLNLQTKGEMAKLRVIPVLDLKAGQVVRAVAGRRQEYRPIVSQLAPSSCPFEVARAFHDHFGFMELYVADLDAIAGQEPAWATYARLQLLGFRLLLDAGIRGAADASALRAAGISDIVLALETLRGMDALERILGHIGSARTVFSLDLERGIPRGDSSGWAEFTPLGITRQVVGLGVERLIVLDLARVGVGAGAGTEDLCRQLRAAYPSLELITGGGMRRVEDVYRLAASGVDAVLVATALHDGRIKSQDLKG